MTIQKEIKENVTLSQLPEVFISEQALKVEELDQNPLKNETIKGEYLRMNDKELSKVFQEIMRPFIENQPIPGHNFYEPKDISEPKIDHLK